MRARRGATAVDPCETQRRRRDEVRQRWSRAGAAYDYARQRVGYYCDLADAGQLAPAQAAWVALMRTEDLVDVVAANPYPAGTPYGSTIWKWAGTCARASYARIRPGGLNDELEEAMNALADCEADNVGVTVPAPPPADAAQPADDDEADHLLDGIGAADPTGDGRVLCGLPRVGHGHVGEPCRIRLGGDGRCQYHGVA